MRYALMLIAVSLVGCGNPKAAYNQGYKDGAVKGMADEDSCIMSQCLAWAEKHYSPTHRIGYSDCHCIVYGNLCQ